MTTAEFIRIQMQNYGIPHEFPLAVQRVSPGEINAAKFFSAGGDPVTVSDRHDLLAMVRSGTTVMMVHKLFGKEAVYKLFVSKDMEVI